MSQSSQNAFAPKFENLPETLAVFPLSGVLLLPTGVLPLNIFEPRYVRMVEDAIKSHRMIGMIQPRESGALYETGCAGKITDFSETTDGRYLITLSGICRFKIAQELETATPYRQVKPDWSPFAKDVEISGCLDIDRTKLHGLLQSYFTEKDMACDWKKIEEAPDQKLITCLAMICPLDAKEKQMLLEAPCCKSRAQTFMTILEMAVHEKQACTSKH